MDTYPRADSMLRCEVRCCKAKLSFLPSSNHFLLASSAMIWKKITKKQIKYYAKRVVGVYGYLKGVQAASAMRFARRRIDANKYIDWFLQAIEAAGEISSAREQWDAGQPIMIVDSKEC